jgi:putative Mn2+ efflux pump MntP
MPAIGWLLGSRFIDYIAAFDHWVAFVLLAVIGINMIRESLKKDEECDPNAASLTARVMRPWPSPPAWTRWRWA